MKYNKGDIVKFEDPWLKKSLFDRITTPKGFRNPKWKYVRSSSRVSWIVLNT